ncbi:MAG TPA: hypothetical protein PK069_01120 [Methanolinea sp.]|nr:hypothetical protein [Methanolinea sp.]HQK55125.1 hypothetical protein [Methanolinea sp.]
MIKLFREKRWTPEGQDQGRAKGLVHGGTHVKGIAMSVERPRDPVRCFPYCIIGGW